MRYLVISTLLYIVISCGAHANTCEKQELESLFESAQQLRLTHAKFFEIHRTGSEAHLVLIKSDEKESGISGQLLWVSSSENSPPCSNFIHIVPDEVRLAALSSTHVAFLNELGKEDVIVAVGLRDHIYHSDIYQKIAAGEIAELGFPPDSEKFLQSEASLLTTFVVSDESVELGNLQRVADKMVRVSEFREKHPLARAEWIKFFGVLVGASNKAQEIFSVITDNYFRLSSSARQKNTHPQVIIGSMQGDHWQASAPDSDFVTLLEDLGVDYIFSDRQEGDGPLSISPEELMQLVERPDFWIPLAQESSLDQLKRGSRLYENFDFLKSAQVWNPVLRVRDSGGNDYWERGSIRPDLVLSDLVSIFWGDSEGSFENRWFKKLE